MAETLGRTLEQARRALGKTISDAESATFIRGKLLAALEAGEYDVLPSPAYVRGYIRNYAKYLGLDPGPLLELYEKETGHSGRSPINLPEPVLASRDHGDAMPIKAILVVVAIIALLGLAVWGVTRLGSDPEPPPPLPTSPETTPTPETTVPAPPATPGVPDPSGDQPMPDEEGGDEEDVTASGEPFSLRVVVDSDSSSWLRVTVDGLTAYEGTMAGGQTREWTVSEEASVRIGRPSAVTVYRDGEDVEIPAGDPPTVVLSAE